MFLQKSIHTSAPLIKEESTIYMYYNTIMRITQDLLRTHQLFSRITHVSLRVHLVLLRNNWVSLRAKIKLFKKLNYLILMLPQITLFYHILTYLILTWILLLSKLLTSRAISWMNFCSTTISSQTYIEWLLKWFWSWKWNSW